MTNVEILASGNESWVRMLDDKPLEEMSLKELFLLLVEFFKYDPDKKPAIE